MFLASAAQTFLLVSRRPPTEMTIDWNFVARNLARHLASAENVEATERTLRDAERDATLLNAPSDFWARVADAYKEKACQLGFDVDGSISARLHWLRNSAGRPQ